MLKQKLMANIERQIAKHLASYDKWSASWWLQWSNLVATEERIVAA